MKNFFLVLFTSTFMNLVYAQELSFSELGSYPAQCRMFSDQNGNGLVYASATGGTPDYTCHWENLETGETAGTCTWGGLNPGNYRITITDDAGDVIIETLTLDSLNPVASFDVISDDLILVPEGYVGFAPITVQFNNTSENFYDPLDPLSDTSFFWNFRYPTDSWTFTNSNDPITNTYTYGGEFDVCLVTYNPNNCADTACVSIGLFGTMAGIKDSEYTSKFKLIPHSNANQISIVNSGINEPFALAIYNTSGQLIIQKNINEPVITLPFNHPKGIYFYELTDSKSERMTTGKFNY